MPMLNSPVLTLNTGMIPIDICNVRDAITLQVLKKAEAIKVDEKQHIRSQYLSLPLPRVIMLFNFHKIPRKRVIHSRLNIIYRDEIKKSDNPDETRKELIQEYKDKFANPYVTAARGYIDDVIDPMETRPRIIRALEMLQNKRDTNPPKKHGNIPL